MIEKSGIDANLDSTDYIWLWDEFADAPSNLAGDDIELFGESFGPFHNKTELYAKLESLENNFPDLIDLEDIGLSYKGNKIPLVVITNEKRTRAKSEFFLVAHHHAREVITVENALYFIDKLVYDFTNGDREIKQILRDQKIYVIPSLNIDSLEIMHLSPAQRKNLRPVDEDGDGILDDNEIFTGIDSLDPDTTIGEDLPGGIDLNRNYGYQWDYPGGSSPENASEVYRGLAPFSEPETLALKEFVSLHYFKSAISLHSGIEMILVPWSYNSSINCPDGDLYTEVGTQLEELTSLTFADLYPCSGEWGDWMYGARGIFSITLEIYGNRYSSYVWDMFNPSADQVISNCQNKVYPGLKFMLTFDFPDLEIIPEDEDAYDLKTLKGELEYSFLLPCFGLSFLILIERIRLRNKK